MDHQTHKGRKRHAPENIVKELERLRVHKEHEPRYEKRAVNYRAMVVIAALMVWLAS